MGKKLNVSRRRLNVTTAALVALINVTMWSQGLSLSAHADSGTRISLSAPIDFATGAEPSSAPFNAAAGDQGPLMVPNATLGDGVAAGDFNRDGKPDVAQSNLIAGTVSVFLGNGKGGFAAPQMYLVGVQPLFVATGDLDQDRNPDLAVANFGSGDVAIQRGSGDGTFQPASFVSVPAARNVAIGRFNADDIPDLAVASSRPANEDVPPVGSVTIFTGRGDATFSQAQVIQTMGGANHVAVGDFDRNDFDDFAVGVGARRNAGDRQAGDPRRTGDDVLVFLNRNRVRGAPAQQLFNTTPDQPAIRVGGSPDAIAVARLNRDHYPDLAVLGQGSGDITTLLGDRRGRFAVKARNVTAGGIPRSVAAGDLNNDRIPDLVTANFQDSTVSVLKGNGDGTFHSAVDFWAGDGTTSVALGHFDDDHRLDVVAARMRTDQLSLLLNNSPGRGDGVVIQRDIYYGSTTSAANDPLATHHTLDVYSPPSGSRSFGPKGQPYPVVLFAHGGGGVGGDKAWSGYLLRSLARSGIVVVSTNYRLGAGLAEQTTQDVAQAFRWVYRHVEDHYRGDPRNIFVFGFSAGAALASQLGSATKWRAEQQRMRGVVLAGLLRLDGVPAPIQRPSLLLNGTEGSDILTNSYSAASSALWVAQGAESEHVTIAGRDHLTLVARMALADDPARQLMLNFLRKHVTRR